MTPFFAAEPLRRYFLWAGATPDEAREMATGQDRETKPWMPENPKTGAAYTPAELSAAFAGFRAVLPDQGRAFDRPDADPYALTNTLTDMVSSASAAGAGADTVFVGLTGKRAVGKSFLTAELEKIGFLRVHPFNPGKALLRGFYASRGATEEEAFAMTDGALKDQPAPRDVLPVDPETGKNYTSRFLMELLGKYMATEMGLSTTIGTEMRHWAAMGEERILIDSVVYEADEIRKMPNSAILGIEVPEHLRQNTDIKAETTDAFVSRIVPDGIIINEMNGAEPLMRNFLEAAARCGIVLESRDETPRP